ncbi:hypothetical protein [Paraburkholderia sp. BCC1884]|uniref:hypothetical protein n=1 Tax=Paraburkholderia sp. BCC1884 TaxID=2562668 RepID=UPI00118212DC|nr:hypothetical protein [Paraburkholderia sp. BCC1884]
MLFLMPLIQVQCFNGGFQGRCFTTLCCVAFAVRMWLSCKQDKIHWGELKMIAFYLSLAALGAAGAALIRQLAAAQAKERAALRPVRVQTADRGTRRSEWRG